MTLLLKDPDARLDYAVDWGPQYLDGDLLVASSWSVVPEEAGGAVIAGSEFGGSIATVQVDQGIAGRLYRITNHVTMASGLEDSRSITLRVEKR